MEALVGGDRPFLKTIQMEAEHTKAKEKAIQTYLEKNKYGRKNQCVVEKYQLMLEEVRAFEIGPVRKLSLWTFTPCETFFTFISINSYVDPTGSGFMYLSTSLSFSTFICIAFIFCHLTFIRDSSWQKFVPLFNHFLFHCIHASFPSLSTTSSY